MQNIYILKKVLFYPKDNVFASFQFRRHNRVASCNTNQRCLMIKLKKRFQIALINITWDIYSDTHICGYFLGLFSHEPIQPECDFSTTLCVRTCFTWNNLSLKYHHIFYIHLMCSFRHNSLFFISYTGPVANLMHHLRESEMAPSEGSQLRCVFTLRFMGFFLTKASE